MKLCQVQKKPTILQTLWHVLFRPIAPLRVSNVNNVDVNDFLRFEEGSFLNPSLDEFQFPKENLIETD